MLMSVHRADRAESEMQFIITAQELYAATVQQYTRIPKRYTFLAALPFVEMAGEILDHVVEGNSFPVTNQHEAQLRRDQFLLAQATIRSLTCRIEALMRIPNVQILDVDTMEAWMKKLDKELILLRAVMKNDRARYKNLP